MAKAWVNFNGTGTVAIRDSYNIASITDNGTGSYTVNIDTDMANTNYCITCSASALTTDATNTNFTAADRAAGSFRIDFENNAGTQTNAAQVDAVVFGDQ